MLISYKLNRETIPMMMEKTIQCFNKREELSAMEDHINYPRKVNIIRCW